MLGIVVNFISALTRLIQPISWSSYTLYFSHSLFWRPWLRVGNAIPIPPPYNLPIGLVRYKE